MVRSVGVLLAALALGSPAAAQTPDLAPDWTRAGGDLFVPAPAPSAAPAAPAPEVPVRIAAAVQPFDAEVAAAAARHGLDPKLVHALVVVESSYRAGAVSPAGAGGLTQLMPATAAALGVDDRFEPVANLEGGAAYLARQVLRFGDLRLALAAYNAGPERVARTGRVPRAASAYVGQVVNCYLALAAGRTVRRVADCQPKEFAP